jgi:hypothetical protein
MSTLEKLTKEYFKYYVARKSSNNYDWNLLNQKRKLEWMKEVMLIANFFLAEMQDKLKIVNNNTPQTSTSYGTGFVEGVKTERTALIGFICDLYKELQEDFNIELNKE